MATEPSDGLVARLRERLDRVRLADGTMLAAAGVVGVVVGALAAGLIGLVRLVERFAFGAGVADVELVLVPVAGAALVWGVSRAAPEVLGIGTVTTTEALLVRRGVVRGRTALVQLAATGVALGTGTSGGREAPVVLLGASIGSSVAARLGLTEQQVRSLVAAGAAAGIGAVFDAPVAGMLFAIEVVLGGLRSSALQVVVVSAVTASVVARSLVGAGLVFAPAVPYGLGDPRLLLLHLLVGIAAGLLAIGVVRATRLARRSFDPLRDRLGDLGALMLGGLVVGLVALVVPEVLGTGVRLPPVDGVRQPVQALLDGAFGSGWGAVGTIAALFAAKAVATAAAVGSRSAVGTIGPTLFLGAALGGGVATAAAVLLPDLAIQPGAFALVGMAAALGGAARAPLAATVLVLELSDGYGLVVPLLLAVGVATLLAGRATPGSVTATLLCDRGLVHDEPDDVRLLAAVAVEEVMTSDHPTVRPALPLPVLRQRFDDERTHGVAVVSGGILRGVVTRADLARADALLADGVRPADTVLVDDLMTTDVRTVGAGDDVLHALEVMATLDIGRVPVVGDSGTYLGMVRRGDLARAHRLAVHEDRRSPEPPTSRASTTVGFLRLAVADGSDADGARIAQLAWPAIVTALTRDGEAVAPRGDTSLVTGDELVVLVRPQDAADVRGVTSRPLELV